MGTRHIIAVQKNNEYKIAQYGQWDGYPDGQGIEVLKFLKGAGNIEKLCLALDKCRFLDYSGIDKEMVESYDANAPEFNRDPDNRTYEQKKWFESFISRDIGADILKNVSLSDESEIILKDSISFAGDSLMCEYGYVIDLDRGTFEVYEGFNASELNESDRFYGLKVDDGEYKQIKLRKEYKLSSLPTEEEFLSQFSDDE